MCNKSYYNKEFNLKDSELVLFIQVKSLKL